MLKTWAGTGDCGLEPHSGFGEVLHQLLAQIVMHFGHPEFRKGIRILDFQRELPVVGIAAVAAEFVARPFQAGNRRDRRELPAYAITAGKSGAKSQAGGHSREGLPGPTQQALVVPFDQWRHGPRPACQGCQTGRSSTFRCELDGPAGGQSNRPDRVVFPGYGGMGADDTSRASGGRNCLNGGRGRCGPADAFHDILPGWG
jgi:hypothetical protein